MTGSLTARPSRPHDRVELRLLREDDEALYCDLYTDADTMRHIGEPLSPERAVRSFKVTLRRTDDPADSLRFYAIVETSTRAAVGICGQQPIDDDGHRVEIGIMLAPQARAHGYSPEAFATMIDLTFAALPIDTVWVQYHPANVAADRLFIGLGMEPYAARASEDMQQPRIARSIHRSNWNHHDFVNNTRS